MVESCTEVNYEVKGPHKALTFKFPHRRVMQRREFSTEGSMLDPHVSPPGDQLASISKYLIKFNVSKPRGNGKEGKLLF